MAPGTMSLAIVAVPPCATTVVAPCSTLYDTRVPAGIGVLPRFDTVTPTAMFAPGYPAFGSAVSM